MSRKNIKKVKDTKFFHKSPPIELNTGFVSLERFIAINEYDDKTFSKEYNCDIINRKGMRRRYNSSLFLYRKSIKCFH